MSSVRVALCQIDAVVGDVAHNRDLVLDALSLAEEKGADIAVFPELVLTGYPPEDLLHLPAFIAENTAALFDIASKSGNCVAVVGFVEPDGDHLHNAAAVLQAGEIKGVWRKELLPNYGVFDEHRWFVPGTGDTPFFTIGGVRVAVSICEDIWSENGPVGRQGRDGAELIVSLNASPYRIDAVNERRAMLSKRAIAANAAIVYVNLVGGQDELVFDGGSMVISADGALVGSTEQFVEHVAVFDVPVPEKPDSGKQTIDLSAASGNANKNDACPLSIASWLSADDEVYDALVCATKSYIEKNGFSEVVIGLSGGIDSSLVAAIATDALGKERVHGVAMPSRFSSSSSHDDAELLATNLGIDFRAIEIEAAHASFLSLLEPHFTGRAADLTEENLQARVRGTLLMALSNKFGWLVLTTGNKSETAVGYSTMYGDSAGGFAVIKDVPKTLVYRLCRARNARAGSEIIPESVLVKAPSAELRPDQRDDDTLPPYDVLDPILEGYVEKDMSIAELVRDGADGDTARRVVDLVDHSEYKRRQAPLGPRVTARGFGKDRRMPITNRFRISSATAFDLLIDKEPPPAKSADRIVEKQ